MTLIFSGLITLICLVLTIVVAVGDLGSDVSMGRRLKAVATGLVTTLFFASFFVRELRWRKRDRANAQKEANGPISKD